MLRQTAYPKAILTIAAIGFCWIVEGATSHACLSCNINNYLFFSVRSATNIYVGTVEQTQGTRTGVVKIVRVLRGGYAPGDTQTIEFYNCFSELRAGGGIVYIETNPRMTFASIVPADYEWEIAFLLRNASLQPEHLGDNLLTCQSEEATASQIANLLKEKTPDIRSAEEAAKCAQGISNITQVLALQYIKEHPKEVFPLLVRSLEASSADLVTTRSRDYAERALDGLAKAIWLADAGSQRKHLYQEVKDYLNQKTPPDGYREGIWGIMLQAEYLGSILKWSKQAPNEAEQLQRLLDDSVPRLTGAGLTNIIYAVAKAQFYDTQLFMDKMKKIVEKQPAKRQAVARAYFLITHACLDWGWGAKGQLPIARFARQYSDNPAMNERLDKVLELDEEHARLNERMREKYSTNSRQP
ncbi:MAG: hypothetical protein NTX50_17625 [Candidatus Sumerlaeota bacterium]|nr:hypothetical protein [Candidatus Sumerlaeota bacterium]